MPIFYTNLLNESPGTLAHRTGSPRILSKQDVLSWFLRADLKEAEWVLDGLKQSRVGFFESLLEVCALDPTKSSMVLAARDDAESYMDYQKTLESDRAEEDQSRSSWPVPGTVTIQFLSHRFYCLHCDTHVDIGLVRMGDLTKASEVRYSTLDCTAREGVDYEARSGTVTFQPGKAEAHIIVPLQERIYWTAHSVFDIELTSDGAVNCEVGELFTTRVEIIQKMAFPSNKYSEQIKEHAFHKVPKDVLFWEFVTLIWRVPKLREGTKRVILARQAHNLYFIFELFINLYLVDSVFSAEHKDHAGRTRNSLLILTIAMLLPLAGLHFLDFTAIAWGLAGGSRRVVQEFLMQQVLTYADNCNQQYRPGMIISALTNDVADVVAFGYKNVLLLIEDVGRLFMVVCYQIAVPVCFHKKFSYTEFLPAIIIPAVVGFIYAITFKSTQALIAEENRRLNIMVDHVFDSLQNRKLFRAYRQQEKCILRFGLRISQRNQARIKLNQRIVNISYIVPWLKILIVAIFTFIGGRMVCQDEMSLGVFLTTVRVFMSIGDSWGRIFEKITEIRRTYPALERIIRLMNESGEQFACMEVHQSNVQRSKQMLSEHTMGSSGRSNKRRMHILGSQDLNTLTITVKDFNFAWITKNKHGEFITRTHFESKGILEVTQGRMVALVGPHGGGKSTLLKMIGANILPDLQANPESPVVVPSHLTVCYVHSDPMFFYATLEKNLTLGVNSKQDVTHQRIYSICKQLGVADNALQFLHNEDSFPWSDILSKTQQNLLSLARAFIASPDVLCFDLLALSFDEQILGKVFGVLRKFVQGRGLEEDPQTWHKRCQRTCITTSSSRKHLDQFNDVVHVNYRNTNRRAL